MSKSSQAQLSVGNSDDHEYHAYLERMHTRFATRAGLAGGRLFTTDANIPISTAPTVHLGLWSVYLKAMPDAVRQYHNCSACSRFVERFGHVVTIDEEGRIDSAFWSAEDACGEYLPAVLAMLKIIRKAKVTGVFLCSEPVWGQPETGVWRHCAFAPHPSMIFNRATQTAGQAMAERKEDFKNLQVALSEFTLPVIEQALTLLETDALYRSEKILGQAQFLKQLHVARDDAPRELKANVMWRLIAAAPAGFCHPRASMIGTLLEDIAAGMAFADVSRRFADKMHPLRYQRPQAAPAAGAIAQAEKIVEQLGAAGALRRRFARVDELTAIWRNPAPKQNAPTEGVFGHLKPKGSEDAAQMRQPAQTMTWVKFAATVLPSADRIEFYARNTRDSWCGLVTAVDPNAPPILQWDSLERRNPVSWYVWNRGSTPAEFSVQADRFHDVEAITLQPSMWGGEGKSTHQGEGVILVVSGARETKQAGNALFPEILKAEFHGIRSVIEAYSRKEEVEGMNEPHACGLMLKKGTSERWSVRLRVTSGARVLEYCLDRWD